MTDFAATYERFLDLLEDEAVREEVTEHVAKMSRSDSASNEYAAAHRDFVRVLKSRAPQVLPPSWRDNPTLEDYRPQPDNDHEDLRQQWKDLMEDEGVFFLGRLPSLDEIEEYETSQDELAKHYGTKGWHKAPGPDKRGVKMPHAPRQTPHGSGVGTRRMVTRMASRIGLAATAERMGKPGAPLRELVVAENKPEATREFNEVFRGAEREEAAEGTGRAGENFKLSAARARGRRADEHQDATVQTTDTAARVSDARRSASEASGKDMSEAELGEVLSNVGDDLDSFTRNILTQAQGFGRFVQGSTVARAWQRKVQTQNRRLAAAVGRLKGGDREQLLEAANEIADAMGEIGVVTAGLEARLQDGPEMRSGLSDDQIEAIDRMAKSAASLGGWAYSLGFAIENEYNNRDAADHERPFGPDEGEDEASGYVLEIKELLAIGDDLIEQAAEGMEATPNRRQFQPTKPERTEAPAPEAPATPAAAPATPAPAAAARRTPKRPVPGTRTETAATPAADEKTGPRTMADAKREMEQYAKEKGLKFRDGFKELAIEMLAEQPDKSAAEVLADADVAGTVLDAKSRDKLTTPAPAVAEAAPATGRKPAATVNLADAVSGIKIPGPAKRSTKEQIERWRADLRSKIKDETKRAKAEKELASALSNLKGDSAADRASDASKKLQRWAKKHDMKPSKSNFYDMLDRVAGGSAADGTGRNANRDGSAEIGGVRGAQGLIRGGNFGGMMDRGNKGSGNRGPIAGDKDWRGGMKKKLRLKPNPLRLPLNDEEQQP